MPRLTAMEGPHKGAFCELAPTEMLIGRMKTCPICLYDEEVSRKHASIVPEGESLIIRDLGSRNGTFVNNDRIKTKSLTDGDTIRIGCSVLLFTSEVGESAADEMTLVATVVSEDADGVMSDFAQQVVAGRSDLALIYSIAETVLREDNVENVLEKLLENLMERFSPAGAFAFLLNSGTNELELVTSRSQTETLPISRTIIQDCFDKKEGILAKNPRADQRFSRMESVWFHNITSALCAPIGRVGVINLCHTSSRRRFTERNLKLLSVIASLVAPVMERAARFEAMLKRATDLVNMVRGQYDIVGKSRAIRKLFELINRASETDSTVLISGESGTGKELVAGALHFNGKRSKEPFVTVNCASLPENLVESELFGHERGAFTGAHKGKPGKFELADNGTLFLDEISELRPEMQAKLLRVLEDGIIQRVGSVKDRKVHVRLLTASNRNLKALASEGRFREDLLYRLEVIKIEVPPLRERLDDIRLLVDHFIQILASKSTCVIRGIAPEALELMKAHPWPGNVRELKNVVERCVVFGKNEIIQVEDILLAGLDRPAEKAPDAFKTLEELERDHIARVLKHCQGRKGKTADLLGIDRKTLARKLKTFDF